MAAYGNYQFPNGYGNPPPPNPYYGGQPQQQPPPPQQNWQTTSFASPAPEQRAPPQRSRSFDPAQSPSVSQALVSFDPYASTTTAPAPAPPAYNNYTLPGTPQYQNQQQQYGQQQAPPYQSPPSFSMEEMTTSPHSQFGFAQPPQQQQQQWNPSASDVSDISMFSNFPQPASTPSTTQQPTSTTSTNAQETALAVAGKDQDFSESSVDPALIAEQERIWQEIQDRRKMERIRADNGVSNPHSRAMIPHYGSSITESGRQLPARTRSMPHPNMGVKPKSSIHSLAHGGVAVLDPKRDKRKQTRKIKTASGAVGGAVLGGLMLGPVGVVLGSAGGATAANKLAKSRDKRKQSEFEQRNFQKGAASSAAGKGDGAFV